MDAHSPTPGPDSSGGGDAETWWRSRARATARLVNLGWWFESLALPLVICSTIGSAGILVWRNQGNVGNLTTIAIISMALPAILAVVCWLHARRHFESASQSLVRIEVALGLDNALSAANAGASAWPQPPAKITPYQTGLRWQWRRLALPPAVAVAALIASLWIPIGVGKAATSMAPREPLAWSQLDAELDALMDSAVVEEAYIEQTRERINELRARDANEWYSHNTMEATDSIAMAHRNEADRLEDALARAQNAVERMRDANAEERVRQFEEYQKAIHDMANRAMQPNEALREQLAEIGLENLNRLTREQLENLRNQLRDANDALRNACGDSDDGPTEPCDGDNEGPPMPGGGPGEGGEHDPNLLGDQPNEKIDTGEFTPLAARDLSHAALGDLLEVQSSPHDTEDTRPGTPTIGGDTDATGRGGDRIWRDTLAPAEQRTLRKFFE